MPARGSTAPRNENRKPEIFEIEGRGSGQLAEGWAPGSQPAEEQAGDQASASGPQAKQGPAEWHAQHAEAESAKETETEIEKISLVGGRRIVTNAFGNTLYVSVRAGDARHVADGQLGFGRDGQRLVQPRERSEKNTPAHGGIGSGKDLRDGLACELTVGDHHFA
jgi:hypothetical protein